MPARLATASNPQRQRARGGRSKHRQERSAEWQTQSAQPAVVIFLTGRGSTIDAVVNCCILATILATTLAMAGRTAIGQATFLAATLVTSGVFFSASFVRGTRVRPNWIDLLLLAGIAVVGFQLIPLPVGVLDALSPATRDALPARFASEAGPATLPSWTTITLAPRETFTQFGMLLAGWLFSIVIRQQARDVSFAEGLLDALTLSATGLAIFGFAQYGFSNGKFFGWFEHPYTTTNVEVKASFTNANHFGQFMTLIAAWPMWRLMAAHRRNADDTESPVLVRTVAGACLLIVLPAALLSFSRAALVSIALVAVVTSVAAVAVSTGEDRKQVMRRLIATALAVCLLGGITLIVAGNRSERIIDGGFQELATADFDEVDHNGGRRMLWSLMLQGVEEFPCFGIGLGAHGSVYQRYWTGEAPRTWYTHGESGPVQILFETGVIGAAILALILCSSAAILIVRSRSVDGAPRWHGLAVVASVVLLVNMIQSVADYGWYVPAIALVVVAIVCAGLAASGPRLSRYGPRIIPLTLLVIAISTAATFGPRAFAAASAEPNMFAYRRMALGRSSSRELEMFAARELLAALQLDRSDPDANEALALLYLRLFDFEQTRRGLLTRSDLRDAVRAGGWSNADEVQNWLRDEAVAGQTSDLLFAARQHALVAARSRPFDIQVGLALLRTNFVSAPGADSDQALLAQLIASGPDDPRVLIERSAEALRLGNTDEAKGLLVRAYLVGRQYRTTTIPSMTAILTADELLNFNALGEDHLLELASSFRAAGRGEDADVLDERAAQDLVSAAELEPVAARRSSLLHGAIRAYTRLGRHHEAAELAEERVLLSPADTQVRLELAKHLVATQDWRAAQLQYEWCLTQSPENDRWRAARDHCVAKLRATEQAAATGDGLPR